MPKQDIKIRSAAGPDFDCYLVTPDLAPGGSQKVPAIVLASAIHGVDHDLRALVDIFATQGYIAAAPDLFWRTHPGALPRDDARLTPRGQPRSQVIKSGEQDLVDLLPVLHQQPQFNGRAAVIGFCYGGPYAILGPARLGYAAGIACHGTQMLDYIQELDGVDQPVCIIWGDQDHAAPAAVQEAYRVVPARKPNVKVHLLPGVLHGYMMRGATKAFDAKAYDFSMARAFAVLQGLR